MTSMTGGCSCGAVRFAIDKYVYVLACHCNACKKRTGSAYGVSVGVENANLTEFRGETKTFTRKGESGNDVHYDFCPACGATLRWRIAAFSSRQIFAAGAFDDMTKFKVVGEVYTGGAIDWARLGCELSRTGEPDTEFRNAMIEKTKLSR